MQIQNIGIQLLCMKLNVVALKVKFTLWITLQAGQVSSFTVAKERNLKVTLGLDCTMFKLESYKNDPSEQYLIDTGLIKYVVIGF